jgi:hypothetical protein
MLSYSPEPPPFLARSIAAAHMYTHVATRGRSASPVRRPERTASSISLSAFGVEAALPLSPAQQLEQQQHESAQTADLPDDRSAHDAVMQTLARLEDRFHASVFLYGRLALNAALHKQQICEVCGAW